MTGWLVPKGGLMMTPVPTTSIMTVTSTSRRSLTYLVSCPPPKEGMVMARAERARKMPTLEASQWVKGLMNMGAPDTVPCCTSLRMKRR